MLLNGLFWTILHLFRYFEQEDEEEGGASSSNANTLAYIPAPGSPSWELAQGGGKESDSEEDPLDAFMAGLDVSDSFISVYLIKTLQVYVCCDLSSGSSWKRKGACWKDAEKAAGSQVSPIFVMVWRSFNFNDLPSSWACLYAEEELQ